MKNLKESLHQEILAYRRIENIVNSDIFGRAWSRASDKNKEELRELARNGNSTIFDRIVHNLAPPITYKHLQLLCRQHSIFRYSRLTKQEMIKELIKHNIIKETDL
jgi:hypothetical protein